MPFPTRLLSEIFSLQIAVQFASAAYLIQFYNFAIAYI